MMMVVTSLMLAMGRRKWIDMMTSLRGIRLRREERAIPAGDAKYDGDSGERQRASVGVGNHADIFLIFLPDWRRPWRDLANSPKV